MVAGATGIDLFLLVIDAAEGARPQTHEHLAIIRLLGIEHGVVAVTKADAVDAETLELALDEARELAPGSEAVAVSARTGAGLDELVAALARVADRVERRQPLAATRLFADRSFSLRGIGTVVTGTLWSGSIGTGDELELAPAGRRIRVRSVQVHERAVDRAAAGQRVAVSLPGVERAEVRRGDALVAPGAFPVSYRLDVLLLELPGAARDRALPAHATVHVHHGTAEHLARLVRVGERYAQLRLATPAVAARGDRLVLREQTTVGGGIVLDPAPPRRPSEERLALLERGDPESIVLGILDAAPEPLAQQDLARRALLSPEDVERGLAAAVRAGAWCLTPARFDVIATRVAHRLAERAATSPLDPGIPLASSCRRGRGPRPSCRCSRSSGEARRRTQGVPAPGSATARRRPSAWRRSSRRAAWPPSSSTIRSWRSTSSGRADSCVSPTGSWCRQRPTRARARSSSRSARLRARSRSRASATWPGRAGV